MSWSRKDIMADIKRREYHLWVPTYDDPDNNGIVLEHDDPRIDKLDYWELRFAYTGCRHSIELRTGGHGNAGEMHTGRDDYRPPDY